MTVELKPNKGASVVKTDIFNTCNSCLSNPLCKMQEHCGGWGFFCFALVWFFSPHRADCAIKATPKLCNPKALPLSVRYV